MHRGGNGGNGALHHKRKYKALIGTLVLFVLLSPLVGDRALSIAAQFEEVSLLFQHGELKASQTLAATLAKSTKYDDPKWTAKFKVLEAQSAAWRGMSTEALRVLSSGFPEVADPEVRIQRLSLTGLAQIHMHRLPEAEANLAQALELCSARDESACTGPLAAMARLALERGQHEEAFRYYSQSLSVAHRFNKPFEAATALMNLGVIRLLEERFDEAIDLFHSSDAMAEKIHAEDVLLNNAGNLGWAYYKLGDSEKALGLYQDAGRRAIELGDPDDTIAWLTASGYVYSDDKDFARAIDCYRQALDLARTIKSKDKMINALEDLAHVSVEAGKLQEAEDYVSQLDPMVRANGNRLDALDVMLAEARIAAARRQDQQAEAIFRAVERDPESQTSMRLGAEHELAKLYELQGNTAAADRMYRTSLASFESARSQLKNEESTLPFFANATRIYDDYIHFLVAHGKNDEALAFADRSRARTLAQGLGLDTNVQAFRPAALHPGAIAQKTGATLLFYWLGEKQSYLWAITSTKTALFPLPARSEITATVERYRKAVFHLDDTLASGNEEGLALYRMLIAPASQLIRPASQVVILNDGALSQLNFESLIVPGPTPHYLIDDATLISAPSLYMLASAKPSPHGGQKLLLLGDPISADPDYPELPMAAFEARQIERHFAAADKTIFARQQANPAVYLTSTPQQYSYIHFVAHGFASRIDPLDSAIILSRSSTAEDSFKLYAREIIQHPIHARLVTISACSGSGSRSYVGEGLVGLSWAFLRAGAHNVIGALWEVSDESTPRMMDALYQGLEDGLSPSAALRQAKLTLLHSEGRFRRPFYWASFQIYAGL